MTELRFVQVDAFADEPFKGNPAAVMPLDAWLEDEVLQAIAMENNLSETAFTVPLTDDEEADYELRWFTPTTEVALCGHATLASGHVLLEGKRVRFRTRKSGILTVTRDEGGLALELPPTLVKPVEDPALLEALGTEAELFVSFEGAELTVIALLEDEAAVRALAPNMRELADMPLMAIVTAAADEGRDYDIVSRVFVPAWGVDEDPVTGSAHAALTPFWCDWLKRDRITAYQASRRGGTIRCHWRDGDRVILRGGCTTVIEGTFRL